MQILEFGVISSISRKFFRFFTELATPIDLILFTLVLYCSPVGFDRSHCYHATILNLAIFSGFRDARTRETSDIWEKLLFWHLFILVSLHGNQLAFFEIPKKFFSEPV